MAWGAWEQFLYTDWTFAGQRGVITHNAAASYYRHNSTLQNAGRRFARPFINVASVYSINMLNMELNVLRVETLTYRCWLNMFTSN
jgi:hypothetical protein